MPLQSTNQQRYRMTNNERTTYWKRLVDRWQVSGLNGSQFCKQNDLDLGQFYYWSSKFLKPSSPLDGALTTGFATVVMSDVLAANSGLRFTLLNGCAIVGITPSNVSLVGALLGQL